MNQQFYKYFTIGLTIFMIYLAYQVVLIIIGGSWALESALMGFLIMTLGFVVRNSTKISGLETDVKYIKHKIYETANNLKEHKKNKKHKSNNHRYRSSK